MSNLYAKDGKIYCKDYTEVYIPMDYFDGNFATNLGSSVETLGLLYIKFTVDGSESPIQLLNLPVTINMMYYDSKNESVKINNKNISVMTLKYLPDSFMFNQSTEKSRIVAEKFLSAILMGKLPKTLDYSRIISIWWRNMEMAGVNYKVPSKIFELILANIYRNPSNSKQRYGEVYGKQSSQGGYDYMTGDVRKIVSNMNTFSAISYEDMNNMLTAGINSTLANEEETETPLEKIIYY